MLIYNSRTFKNRKRRLGKIDENGMDSITASGSTRLLVYPSFTFADMGDSWLQTVAIGVCQRLSYNYLILTRSIVATRRAECPMGLRWQ
jgi:hypothetical protein